MNIHYKSLSKCGKRTNNEDVFNIIDAPQHHRWFGIVCDGLGGHPHGEVASKTVCDAISNYLESHYEQPDDKDKILDACEYAQNMLDEETDKLNHVEMGTTMVMASIHKDNATIAWLGDSRAYYVSLKSDRFYRTRDDVKQIFDQIIVSHSFFSYRSDWNNVSVMQLPIEDCARLVLCSDGLYNAMEVAAPALLWKGGLGKETAERFIEIADATCAKFGDDNYTAIMALINE